MGVTIHGWIIIYGLPVLFLRSFNSMIWKFSRMYSLSLLGKTKGSLRTSGVIIGYVVVGYQRNMQQISNLDYYVTCSYASGMMLIIR